MNQCALLGEWLILKLIAVSITSTIRRVFHSAVRQSDVIAAHQYTSTNSVNTSSSNRERPCPVYCCSAPPTPQLCEDLCEGSEYFGMQYGYEVSRLA